LLKGDETLEYLAKQASTGNEECFTAICRTLEKKLFRTAKGILGNETLSLDAVSEAVFRTFKGIKRLREPRYAETWFIRIVVNAANDILRRRKHEIVMENVPEGVYYERNDEWEFNRMIESLPVELREIISLKYYSGYTLKEISNILKIPEGTVKSRLNKALTILRLEVLDEK